jgi:hypothetical protein
MLFRTYFRPGENDRRSRWDAARQRMSPLPTRDARHQDADTYLAEFHKWHDAHRTEVRERLGFLSEPYQTMSDPLDQIWRYELADAR